MQDEKQRKRLAKIFKANRKWIEWEKRRQRPNYSHIEIFIAWLSAAVAALHAPEGYQLVTGTVTFVVVYLLVAIWLEGLLVRDSSKQATTERSPDGNQQAPK